MEGRKGNSIPWTHGCSISICPGVDDIIEFCEVDKRGYPKCRREKYAGKQATVILGRRNDDIFFLCPESKVWTCFFGPKGHLSSISNEYAGKDVTVIIHQ